MASRRMETGKKAVWLISNAEKVGSFCNDLVGDICGVMSGATGAAIAARLFDGLHGDVWLTADYDFTDFGDYRRLQSHRKADCRQIQRKNRVVHSEGNVRIQKLI
jgi:hypothetical protein